MVAKDFYTSNQLEVDIERLALRVQSSHWQPDVIVGILRGGIVPAVYLSHLLKAPLVAIEWSTRDDAVGKEIPENLLGYLYSDANILLVDDICDSGLTLSEIYEELGDAYKQKHYALSSLGNLRSLVIHYNEGQENFAPDYFEYKINKAKDNVWLVYPWEIE